MIDSDQIGVGTLAASDLPFEGVLCSFYFTLAQKRRDRLMLLERLLRSIRTLGQMSPHGLDDVADFLVAISQIAVFAVPEKGVVKFCI